MTYDENEQMVETDELLTTEEVGDILRLSRTTVRRHIQEGHLAAVKIGRLFRVRRSELMKFLKRSSRF